MTKDELFEKLKPVASGLQNKLTSKQHAFNSNKHLVEECKCDGINNKLIVEAINSHLPDEDKITLTYFKNLLTRSRVKNIAKSTSTLAPQPFKGLTSDNVKEHSVNDGSLLKEYLKVCFGVERLALRAIEADVSIEIIKSWKCPNQVNLGTTLSNYIQNR